MSHFISNNILIHIIIIISSIVISICLLDWIIQHNYDVYSLSSPSSSSSPSTLRASSIWCNGDTSSNRRCRLHNLCYKSDTKDYVFFYDSKASIESGIPDDRFKPTLAELSSVANHNKYYFNYVHIPVDAYDDLAKQYRIRRIKGKTIIFGRFKPDNVMHLMHDDILPLMSTLLDWDIRDQVNLFLDDEWFSVNSTLYPFSGELYWKLFDLNHILYANKVQPSDIVCFEEAFVGLSKTTIWYQYGFRSPQGPLKKNKYDVQILTKLVDKISYKLFGDQELCEQHYALLLMRHKTRLILNQHDVVTVLSTVAKLPVVRIRLEGFTSLVQLIKKFKCAKLLTGLHGSGFVFAMFMPRATSVIEMFPYAINPDHYTPYKTLAKLFGLQYYSWRNLDIKNTVTHPDNPPEHGGISHLPFERREAIRLDNEDVQEHLCCNDPSWLHRIYQDTFVDSHSFQAVLKEAISKLVSYDPGEDMPLSPGPVRNLKCKRIQTNDISTVNATWLPPWNVQYFGNGPLVSYEALAHFSNDSANMLHSQETSRLIDMNPNDSVTIWVRAVVEEEKGPFVREPVSC